jgi:hypothetical protein
MKYLDEYRDEALAKGIVAEIRLAHAHSVGVGADLNEFAGYRQTHVFSLPFPTPQPSRLPGRRR